MKALREQTGFVMPTVIFALVILGVVAVAALSMAAGSYGPFVEL